jgi:hypothetical protein
MAFPQQQGEETVLQSYTSLNLRRTSPADAICEVAVTVQTSQTGGRQAAILRSLTSVTMANEALTNCPRARLSGMKQ